MYAILTKGLLPLMTTPNVDYFNGKLPIGKAAMLLALTSTRQEEAEIKSHLKNIHGYDTVVTEIGGVTREIKDRVVKSVVNAALNAGILEKKGSHVHPLIHATLEAERGMMIDIPAEASITMKVAIVVGKEWLAVAVYGESALHVLSNHERAGLGIMHL